MRLHFQIFRRGHRQSSTTDQDARVLTTAVSGSFDTANLTLNGTSAGTVTIAGVETVNIASDGSGVLTTTRWLILLAISLSQNLVQTAGNSIGANAETVNASALTGNFVY